jgi:phosphoenolpyruvate carboxykinase (GTP)
LSLPTADVTALTTVDIDGWKKEIDDVASNYGKFGSHLPKALTEQLDNLRKRLG